MLLVLFNPYIGPYQVLPLRARVDLGVMAMKGYSAFPKAPVLLEPHHQIVLCHIQDTRWRDLTPLQRCSQCMLQLQPTGQTNSLIAYNHLQKVLRYNYKYIDEYNSLTLGHKITMNGLTCR